MYQVYILKTTKEKIYIGYTSDLKRRYKEHNTTRTGYTKNDKWELIYYEAYKNKLDAQEREQQLKNHGQAKRWLKERIKRSFNE